MLKRPWQRIQSPRGDEEYLAVVTYFLLKGFRGLPRFNLYTGRVQQQLKRTEGLVGYTIGAKPWRKQFWTLSVWENEQTLRRFVYSGFHKGVMIVLKDDMADFSTRSWSIEGDNVPPDWVTALERLDSPQKT